MSKPRGPNQRNIPATASETKDLSTVVARIVDVPNIDETSFNAWLTSVYDVSQVTEQEVSQMWEAFSYKGFNRSDVLKQLFSVAQDPKIARELVILCALRGPQAASQIKLSNSRTPINMGIPASGGQGSKTLTCNKISAATADLAAYFLKRMNCPKRMESELPGWLQFPAAGSIKLPAQLRDLHMQFSRNFSSLIGGNFQVQIYEQMVRNAYLDPTLNLFN
jgi:hypothetical protein